MPTWLWESMELSDALDIFLVSFILYQTLLLLRGTRAVQSLAGPERSTRNGRAPASSVAQGSTGGWGSGLFTAFSLSPTPSSFRLEEESCGPATSGGLDARIASANQSDRPSPAKHPAASASVSAAEPQPGTKKSPTSEIESGTRMMQEEDA